MLTGRPVGADEAERIGLVSRVVPDSELPDAALQLARDICANAPFAVEMTKRLLWSNLSNDFDEAVDLENRTQLIAGFTGDASEAKTAFVERRPPAWGAR
jgi:enoyl-CoA hydratase